MENRKGSFYGATGRNGYGVYADYEEACRQQKYIRNFSLKEFKNEAEAKEWVIQQFMLLQNRLFLPRLVESLNWTFYPLKEDPSTWRKQPLCVYIEEAEEKEEEIR